MVRDEVHRPALIGTRHLREIHAGRRREPPPTFGPHVQALALVQPVHALVIHVPPASTQDTVDAAVASSRPLARDLAHRLDELALILRARLVANRRALYADRFARATLGHREWGLDEKAHDLPSDRGRYHFFESTSFSASLSSSWSARRLFSRLSRLRVAGVAPRRQLRVRRVAASSDRLSGR